MKLRDYQAECVASVFEKIADHRSTVVVMATGCGKTATAAAVIKEWFDRGMPGRVLWLAHRDELIQQAKDTIEWVVNAGRKSGEIYVAVEMGDRSSVQDGLAPPLVTAASVQTLSRERRIRRFNPASFGLIVTDEAHHATARSYRGIYDYFYNGNPKIAHLGLTATPNRADNSALGKVFNSVAYQLEIADAIGHGWLVPVRQAIVVLEELDLSQISTIGGDFNASELEAVILDPRKEIALKMAKPVIETCGRQSTLIFTVNVAQARIMCDYLNDASPDSAKWISGETPKNEREEIISGFRAGKFYYLLNCAVLTEGFDAPNVAWVVMARPTKSLSLYAQMLGRGTRPLPGTFEKCRDSAERKAAIDASLKPFASVLDFVGNSGRLGTAKTISAIDILGGNYSDDVRDYAKSRVSEERGGSTVGRELDKSDAEIQLFKEEDLRRARIIANNQYRVEYIEDGVDYGPTRNQSAKMRGEPATEKQIWKLCSLGVPRYKAERCTKKQATGWIGRLLGEK